MVQNALRAKKNGSKHFMESGTALNHFLHVLNIFSYFIVNQRKSRTFAPRNHGVVLVNSLKINFKH